MTTTNGDPQDPTIRQASRAKRSTYVALTLAFVVVTLDVGWQTRQLHHQASLSSQIRVDWAGWILALVLAYAGLALIGSSAIARDRRRAKGVR